MASEYLDPRDGVSMHPPLLSAHALSDLERGQRNSAPRERLVGPRSSVAHLVRNREYRTTVKGDKHMDGRSLSMRAAIVEQADCNADRQGEGMGSALVARGASHLEMSIALSRDYRRAVAGVQSKAARLPDPEKPLRNHKNVILLSGGKVRTFDQ